MGHYTGKRLVNLQSACSLELDDLKAYAMDHPDQYTCHKYSKLKSFTDVLRYNKDGTKEAYRLRASIYAAPNKDNVFISKYKLRKIKYPKFLY